MPEQITIPKQITLLLGTRRCILEFYDCSDRLQEQITCFVLQAGRDFNQNAFEHGEDVHKMKIALHRLASLHPEHAHIASYAMINMK